MQQSWIFVFILLVSFFSFLTAFMIWVVVSEIKMEKMLDQIIKETEN